MWFDIARSDDNFGYKDASGLWNPVVPISAVLPEWEPKGVYFVKDGISLIEFTRGNEQATWFADEELCRISGSVHELTDARSNRVREIYTRLIEELYDNVFVDRQSVADPSGFFNVNPLTRTQIAQLCFPMGENPTIQDVAAEPCDLPFIATTLYKDFQDGIISGAPTHSIELLDPADGESCLVKHGISLDDFRSVYQLKSRGGREFWVCVSEHYASILGLYEPSIRKFYVVSDYGKSRIQNSFGSLDSELRHLAATFGDVLPPYLNATHTRVASFIRPSPSNHLGHQLWNELSGIQFAISRLARNALPTIVIPSADQGTETFGPTEQIFPELQRLILRWPAELDFRRHAIISGLTLVRLSQRKITAELRSRINVRIAALPELQSDRDMLADLLNRRRRIFVLGLRVENRTITDLETFVRNFVRLCAEVVPGCAIVLDGHNAQRGGAGESRILSSHGQWSAKRQPIEVERELAAAAFEEANGRNVEIINLIGESVDRSMFWSFQADCFVAIWGAGLAKYRWVANCPGYIITSAWNRLHRPDLHIYSSHDFMDAPSEIQFVPADEIEDLPDAIQLVSFPTDQQSESYYNFAIKDHERLTFLRRYLADRG